MPGRARSDCTDATLMILPRPRLIMPRATAPPDEERAVRSVSTTRRQSAASRSTSGTRCCTPALLTRTPTGPTSASTRRHGGVDRRLVGDVEGVRVHAVRAEPSGELGAGPLEPVGVAAVQHDGRAGAGEALGQRAADAPARAGDQRDRPREVEQGGDAGLGHRAHPTTRDRAAPRAVRSARAHADDRRARARVRRGRPRRRPPVLLLHGWPDAARGWGPVAARLADAGPPGAPARVAGDRRHPLPVGGGGPRRDARTRWPPTSSTWPTRWGSSGSPSSGTTGARGSPTGWPRWCPSG